MSQKGTISAEDAARKLGVDIAFLAGHQVFTTVGSAYTPQRFWGYQAYTKAEFESLPVEVKRLAVIKTIVH